MQDDPTLTLQEPGSVAIRPPTGPILKSLENFRDHTKPLPPSNYGVHVFIQNNTGSFPNKWGKGMWLAIKDFHQYVVKVGRLTVRHRKFLRQFIPWLQNSGQ